MLKVYEQSLASPPNRIFFNYIKELSAVTCYTWKKFKTSC